MSTANLPIRLSLGSARTSEATGAGRGAIPDPILHSEYYAGVLSRRVFAYAIDLMLIGLISFTAAILGFIINLATFWLLSVFIAAALICVAPAYHVLTVGGPHAATPGMRLMGLQVHNFDGGAPSRLQAFIQIALFYATVPTTGGWILLVALFNRHRRAVHDMLSHTVMLRRLPLASSTGVRPFAA